MVKLRKSTHIGSVYSNYGFDAYYLVHADPDEDAPSAKEVEEAVLPNVYLSGGPGQPFCRSCTAIEKPFSDGYTWIVVAPVRYDV